MPGSTLFKYAAPLALAAGVASATSCVSREAMAKNLAFANPIAGGVSLLDSVGEDNGDDCDIDSDSDCEVDFPQGIASGDPLEDSVILWTRAQPNNCKPGKTLKVHYVVRNAATGKKVASDKVYTNADVDYVVKVDASGLDANTKYTYEFKSNGSKSIRGRTKTLPAEGADVDSLNMAVMSCSNYLAGYFNAYAQIASKADELDFAVHLGDYIYEYAGLYNTPVDSLLQFRVGEINSPQRDTVTLEDYRLRYQQYRADSDSIAVARDLPFIFVPDDHEVANDAFELGAENHNSTTQGDFQVRKNAGLKAWFENMPVRQVNAQDTRIYRNFKVGNLANLIMLNTRFDGRSEQREQTDAEGINNPGQNYINDAQFEWLKTNLQDDSVAWKIMGNQAAFTPFNDPLFFPNKLPFGTDSWNGYAVERQNVINEMTGNTIIITGDQHWAVSSEVPCSTLPSNQPAPEDPYDGLVVTEEICSTCFADAAACPLALGSLCADQTNPLFPVDFCTACLADPAGEACQGLGLQLFLTCPAPLPDPYDGLVVTEEICTTCATDAASCPLVLGSLCADQTNPLFPVDFCTACLTDPAGEACQGLGLQLVLTCPAPPTPPEDYFADLAPGSVTAEVCEACNQLDETCVASLLQRCGEAQALVEAGAAGLEAIPTFCFDCQEDVNSLNCFQQSSAFVGTCPQPGRAGTCASEFIVNAVSSPGVGRTAIAYGIATEEQTPQLIFATQALNPHFKYVDDIGGRSGYHIMRFTKESVKAEIYFANSDLPNASEQLLSEQWVCPGDSTIHVQQENPCVTSV